MRGQGTRKISCKVLHIAQSVVGLPRERKVGNCMHARGLNAFVKDIFAIQARQKILLPLSLLSYRYPRAVLLLFYLPNILDHTDIYWLEYEYVDHSHGVIILHHRPFV